MLCPVSLLAVSNRYIIGQDSQTFSFFPFQVISNSLWAFATLRYSNKDAYRGIVSRVSPDRAWEFETQDLGRTLWAIVTAGVFPQFPDAFDTSMLPQSIRPTLKEIQRDPITMFFAIGAQELMRRPHKCNSQDLSNVLWSFSKVNFAET